MSILWLCWGGLSPQLPPSKDFRSQVEPINYIVAQKITAFVPPRIRDNWTYPGERQITGREHGLI